jgi:hypothetical protein
LYLVRSCRSFQYLGWDVSKETESAGTATGALALDRIALPRGQQSRHGQYSQQTPAELETCPATAIGEKAEVTNLDEAGWQNVKEKAPNEFDCFDRHELLCIVVG